MGLSIKHSTKQKNSFNLFFNFVWGGLITSSALNLQRECEGTFILQTFEMEKDPAKLF